MTTLSDTDLLAWSEQQASRLRGLADVAEVSGADWDRLAAEIEGVGRWVLATVERGLRDVLAPAILGFCDPDSPDRHPMSLRVLQGRHAASREMSPTVRARLDLDRLWRESFDLAMRELEPGILGVPPLPRACPFTLDELLAEDFTYDEAVKRLYVRLTSWRPPAAKDDPS